MQISSNLHSNVSRSTRINSSSVHTYIFRLFYLRVILQGFVTQNATSPKKRSKGSLLLHYLENSENIQWKENGEVVYKQKVIPNSNIITLITHAIQNNKSKPVGMKSFYKILAKANIPSKLILNRDGRHIMKKTLDERSNIWRPPGRLNKR